MSSIDRANLMAQSKHSHEAMADPGSAVLHGEELWKSQFRKEHMVLLEKIEAIGRASQALPANFEKRFDDYEDLVQTLFTKNTKLENNLQQFKNDLQPFIDALQTIKKELQQLKEKAEIWDKEIAGMKPLVKSSGLHAPGAQRESLEKGHHEGLTMNTAFTSQRDQHLHETNPPIIGANPHLEAATPSLATPAKAILNNPPPTIPQLEVQAKVVPANNTTIPATIPLPKPNRRTANRKSSSVGPMKKIHWTRRRKVSPPAPPIAKPAAPIAKATPSKLPRLMQGPGSVLSYHTATDKIYPEYERQGGEDTWFVNTFIAGLSAEKDKKALIAVLMELHVSVRMKDGGVEIRCWWDDVEEGMVKAGLIPEKETDDNGPSAKKRKN